MAGVPEELVRAFYQMLPKRVAEGTDHWLAIEQGQRERMTALRRLLHTVKGEAQMLGLKTPAELLEEAEELVDAVVPHGKWPAAAGDALLSALELLAVLDPGATSPPPDLDDVLARLASARADLARAAARSRPPAGAHDEVEAAGIRVGAQVAPLATTPPEGSGEPKAPAVRALAVDEVQPLSAELRRLASERDLVEPRVRELAYALRTLADRAGRLPPEETRRRVAELGRALATAGADLSQNAFAVERVLDRVEELVQKASVVPLSRLEGRIHRTARTAAQSLGKQVDVVVRGEAMIDSQIEQRLAPALVHLVRNALDHGIEDPETRRARGKSERGKVQVTFDQMESSVRVVVEDDGRGIDFEAVRAQVARRGEDSAKLTQAELLAALFEHGLTTRAEANELSGRGVGLDVVAAEVALVGGRVHAESTPGAGTRLVLVMPATLRVDIALPIAAGGVRYAVPSRVVLHVLKLGEIEPTHEGPMFRVQVEGVTRPVPVRSLAGVIGERWIEPRKGDPAVVLAHPSGAFAVTVDAYEIPRPLAAQPARELAFRSRLVRGVAPTPDGGVLLLLDVFALREAVAETRSWRGTGLTEKPPAAAHVLVVEDAPVARELLAGILRSFGLRVSAAADGVQGLAVARRDRPDLVLTDIEMPQLDGLEMVARMRREPALSTIPVLILSDRQDEVARRRAATLGVRGYLAKARFVEADLRELIAQCLGRGRSR